MQTDNFLFWCGSSLDVQHWQGQASWAWPSAFHSGQLSIKFVYVGGWLTSGDSALDSCAQFLAVAEHTLIPSRARSVCHQLRKAGQLCMGSCLSGSCCWWSCWCWCCHSWRCPPVSPIFCHSSVSGVFQVGSGFENHSSYCSRRSGSSFCCLWLSRSGGGC